MALKEATQKNDKPQHSPPPPRDGDRKAAERKDLSKTPITRWEEIEGREKVKEWVASGINGDAIKFARVFGEYLAGRTKEEREEKKRLYGESFNSNVVRKLFTRSYVLSRNFDEKELMLLVPELHYLDSSSESPRARAFSIILENGVEAVNDGSVADKALRFSNLHQIFEMIINYHKAAGGK